MVGPIDVVCATTGGTQATYQIGWDNSQSFFDGKGYIPRLFCEGGYAYQHPVYVSDNLSDASLGYYNGLVISPEPTPTTSPTPDPTASQTPSPTPTESASPTPSPSSTTEPTPQPSPSATVEPSPTASPEPSQSTPSSSPTPEATPTSTEQPMPTSSPTPSFPNNSVYATGDEWGTITLTAPVGTVFISVYFANYGLPIDYKANPDCSADVTNYVAAVFIGKNTGTVEVTNVAVNGDPCYGVGKHMSIILIYGPDTSQSTSESGSQQTNQTQQSTDTQTATSSQSPDTSTVTESTTATSEPSTPTPVPSPSPTPEPARQPDPTPTPVVPIAIPDPEPIVPDVVPPMPDTTGPVEETQNPADTTPVEDTQPVDQTTDATTSESNSQSQNDNSSTSDQSQTQPTDSSQSSESTAPSETSTPSVPEQPTDTTVTPEPTTPEKTSEASNDPNQLPESTPKLPPAEVLVPHVQVDKAGVTNGGIEFFGTKSQPQVVGEDGKLTPPPPPPGSGLPIPPDAITIADTFIGQPGGTTFNAPDVAVPIIETPVEGALAAVPGVQALNHAFVAMANIGNDMSPVTRKKAKKILVITTVIAAVGRRFK